ncbi:molybdenum ABC transporter ATP-binding protein [Teredinibacter haidensis]|uniref:molybdenum ABC transporter ATP-binding protein n=1 Tax=Teredinibacter haidensis TaxID=2731755 RepID=UPI000948B5BC|nr:molybdenum ABC transporter ATP-binding protein [Teredinibacter haidensis]
MNDLRLQYDFHKDDFHTSVDLTLPAQGITAIFGASGSGKTTLLRTLAGLEKIQNGHIRFKSWVFQNDKQSLPVHKRPIGYVFQQSSLFPHLNVRKNLQYGYKRIPVDEHKIRFDDAVQLLGVASLLERYPHQLSGGQQQRVGIARALLTSPQLLLMDEPLASLDAKSKAEILPYLETLHQQLDIPILYVSHSVEEVVRIADRMVLMDHGKILATGPLNELLTDPALPLSHLEEACIVTDGIVTRHQPGFHLTELSTDFGSLVISHRNLAINQPVRVKIMARDVSIALDFAERTSISNILPVTVEDFIDGPNPSQILVKLRAKGSTMLSRITRRSLNNLKLQKNQIVYAQIKAVSLMRDQVQ